jgi:hypothetical protein
MFLVEKSLNPFIDTVQYSLATPFLFVIGISREMFFKFFKFSKGCPNNNTAMSNDSAIKQALTFGTEDKAVLELTEFILGHKQFMEFPIIGRVWHPSAKVPAGIFPITYLSLVIAPTTVPGYDI